MKNSKTMMKTLRLKKEIVDEVQKMADNDNRSFTNMVETILLKSLKK